MKKEMDTRLYKFEIIKRKEENAEKWLNFLNANRKAGEALLKDEHAYLEAYFKTMGGGNMHAYKFFTREDVNASDGKAINQGNGLDEQHFAYMRECIDLFRGDIMECILYLDNPENVVR